MLGRGPLIGAWITTSLRRDGTLMPMDRGGNPSFNPILNADDIKDEFNSTDPVDDVKNYLQPLSEALQRHGYSPGEATAAARTLLPDILHYDRTRPARYPNGRLTTDDVFSARMIFMPMGGPIPRASNHTTTCWPTSPTSAHPTPSLRTGWFPRRRRDEDCRLRGSPHRRPGRLRRGVGDPPDSRSPSLEAGEPGGAMATSSASTPSPVTAWSSALPWPRSLRLASAKGPTTATVTPPQTFKGHWQATRTACQVRVHLGQLGQDTPAMPYAH